MTQYGGFSGEHLRQYIAKIEQLETEKADIAEAIRDVFGEAKGNGFDPKIMRQVLKIRKMEAHEREELETLLDVYLHALGMAPGDSEEEEESEITSVAVEEEEGEDEEVDELEEA